MSAPLSFHLYGDFSLRPRVGFCNYAGDSEYEVDIRLVSFRLGIEVASKGFHLMNGCEGVGSFKAPLQLQVGPGLMRSQPQPVELYKRGEKTGSILVQLVVHLENAGSPMQLLNATEGSPLLLVECSGVSFEV